jgi:hypothetical protein
MNDIITAGRHPGPSLTAVAIVYTALFVVSLVVVAAITGGEHFPSPLGPPGGAAAFFADHAGAVRWSAFLQFGAAIPLAIFTATAASRLGFLGVRAAGPTLALVNGTVASVMIALSGLAQWCLAQPGVAASDAAVRVLHLLAFGTGGPGFVVPFGVLVAGIAVSAGLSQLVPRWVMWSGLVIAAIAELSALFMLSPAVALLLPLARFSGMVWMIAIGIVLPAARRSP